jgi:hypothetical protein
MRTVYGGFVSISFDACMHACRGQKPGSKFTNDRERGTTKNVRARVSTVTRRLSTAGIWRESTELRNSRRKASDSHSFAVRMMPSEARLKVSSEKHG